jgi:hypothetical protein
MRLHPPGDQQSMLIGRYGFVWKQKHIRLKLGSRTSSQLEMGQKKVGNHCYSVILSLHDFRTSLLPPAVSFCNARASLSKSGCDSNMYFPICFQWKHSIRSQYVTRVLPDQKRNIGKWHVASHESRGPHWLAWKPWVVCCLYMRRDPLAMLRYSQRGDVNHEKGKTF